MNLAYVSQLCAYSTLLIQKQRELLAAFKEQQPVAEVQLLKKDLAALYRAMREMRATAVLQPLSLPTVPLAFARI